MKILNSMSIPYNLCIVGLGYVGLPLAVEFSKKFNVIGFDFNSVPSFTMYKYWFCDLIIKNNLNF